MTLENGLPRWALDLKRFLPLRSHFLLSGNVRDLYLWNSEGRASTINLTSFLSSLLRDSGAEYVVSFDPVNGFQIPSPARANVNVDDERGFFTQEFGISWDENGCCEASVARFFNLLSGFVHHRDSICVLADFSSQYLIRPDSQTQDEHDWFTSALVLSLGVRKHSADSSKTSLFNSAIWIAEKEGDLPPWFAVGNPRLRSINIPTPDRLARKQAAEKLVSGLPDGQGKSVTGTEQVTRESKERNAAKELVDLTHGLMLRDLVDITELCRYEGVGIENVSDGIRRFKLGVEENPWAKLDREKIQKAGGFISRRVKGQAPAVTQMLDIVKRSVLGLTSSESRSGRPRGVAFLAGPTGTGKTELAKSVTELLFGDQNAYIRFDMSEFSAEHSDQRLIGAPPGYVGYDSGGELTNAIKEKPFSVVLFDEIEKAHPRILDKFLQILDDGVLTSGRGERVYFSEAFLVFTSNLGLFRVDQASGERVPNTTPDDSFPDVELKIRSEINRFFKLDIGRPEILNRIGENIIVFDFIREDVGEAIFDMMLDNLLQQIASACGRQFTFNPSVKNELKELCLADLSNGGRGIRNQLEANLLNPLARAIFDEPNAGATLIESIDHHDGLTSLRLA